MPKLNKLYTVKPPIAEQRPFWREYFVYAFEYLPLTAGTTNALPNALPFTSLSPILKLDSDSDFEHISTVYVATDSRVYMRISDNTMGRRLHTETIDMRAYAGQVLTGITANGFIAREMTSPHLFRAATTIGMEMADFSGSNNTIRVALHGCKVRPGRPPYAREYQAKTHHTYIIQPATISANQTQIFTLSTDNDSDFMVNEITGIRSGAALVSVKHGSKNWMNIPVHFDNLIGNGQFPNRLKYPVFIKRGETIIITVQDLSGSDNIIKIQMEGWKLFG